MSEPFKFTIADAMKAAGYDGIPGGTELIDKARQDVRERKHRVIDTFDLLVCRDGVDDIPVEVNILSVYQGTNDMDDPTEVEFGNAYVTADVPPFTNRQAIELTEDELERAQEDYLNQ